MKKEQRIQELIIANDKLFQENTELTTEKIEVRAQNVKLAQAKNNLEDKIKEHDNQLDKNKVLLAHKINLQAQLQSANAVIYTLETLLVRYITDKQQQQLQQVQPK